MPAKTTPRTPRFKKGPRKSETPHAADAGLVCAAREKLGMKQTELAHALGLQQSEISRFERGLRTLTVCERLALECLLRRAKRWPLRAR